MSKAHVNLEDFGGQFVVLNVAEGEIVARFSWASKPNTTTVYATVWVGKYPNLIEGQQFTIGSGKAGGSGYDKESSALYDACIALREHGITLVAPLAVASSIVFVNNEADRIKRTEALESLKGTGQAVICPGNGLRRFEDLLNATLPEGYRCIQTV